MYKQIDNLYDAIERIHELEDAIALRDSEIKDSYRTAQHQFQQASTPHDATMHFGSMEALKALMGVFNIRG